MGIGSRCGLAAILVMLGGCAHTPPFQVTSSGAWPAGDKAAFGFGHFDAGEDEALRSRIKACLVHKGMTASDSPAYLVQVAQSDRPAKADILAGNQPAAPAPGSKALGRQPSHSLLVNLTDMSNGREVYRVEVTEHYRRPAKRRRSQTIQSAPATTAAAGFPAKQRRPEAVQPAPSAAKASPDSCARDGKGDRRPDQRKGRRDVFFQPRPLQT